MTVSTLPRWFILFSIVFFALITVVIQEQALGLPYLEGEQWKRHVAVLNDTAQNPWNYRPLADWLVEPALIASRALHVPHAVATGFIAMRMMQNILIFAAGWFYYRMLGLGERQSIIGLLVLSFCFLHALPHADLSFNTYFDLLFYLIAAILVVQQRYLWLIPLAALASCNRETGLVIPMMSVLPALYSEGRKAVTRRRWIEAGIGTLLFLAVFTAIRIVRHKDVGDWAKRWGNEQGWPTLSMNLHNLETWIFAAVIFSILPLFSIVRFRSLPLLLKSFWWPLVPVWVLVHYLSVYAGEVRYYLVPMAVVLIPALLWPLPGEKGQRDASVSGSIKGLKATELQP
jgi:hypothetical protein